MSQANADSAQQTAGAEADAPATDSNHETTTTPEAGNQGQGGSGEADSQESTPTLDERIANVSDPADFEAMMAEVQQNPDAFANPTEDQHPDDQQAQGESAEGEGEAPPEGEEAAEGEEAEEQEESAEGEDAEESEGEEIEGEADEDSEEDEEEEESHPRFRLRPTDKVDAEAMRIKKAAEAAGSPISLSEALDIAKRNLGVADKPADNADASQDAEDQGDTDDPTQGVTLAEAKADLKDLRKRASQALRDGDLDEAADLNDQISDTEDLIDAIAERDQRESQTQRQQHDAAFESSVARATDLYPDFGNQKSEFYQRCTEIDEALRDTDDPRYFDAEKPLMIAQMAARELNVAPKRKGAKPAKKVAKKTVEQSKQTAPATAQTPQQQSTSPQPPRTEKPGQLPAASGASRTSGAPTGAAASLAEQVANIDNPEDFERLAKQVHSASR